jgi:hypothetical protein
MDIAFLKAKATLNQPKMMEKMIAETSLPKHLNIH